MTTTLIGQTLKGTYRLDAQLGHGGMGLVFDSYDLRLGRRVAVKIVHPELSLTRSERETRRQFESEGHLLARLRHPHILDVYALDFADFDGDELPFLVLEYAAGGTLESRLKAAPLAPQETLRVISQICAALDHAHDAGVIHLDLKPSNVLFDAQDNVRVADFGISKLLKDTTRVKADTWVGTPKYWPPEQAFGNLIGPWTDIFPLGVMIAEMLTGKPPERAPNGSGALETLDSLIPEAVAEVIHRATHPDSEQRFHRASHLAAALAAALDPQHTGVDINARLKVRLEARGAVASLVQQRAVLEALLDEMGTVAPDYLRPELEDVIVELDHARRRLAVAEQDKPANPYRGIETFDTAHAHRFFGRSALITTLVERLRSTRFLAVIGASGSGKSSLVLAGLIPALRTGALPGSESWIIRTLRLSQQPLRTLALLLTHLRHGGDDRVQHLEEDLRRNPRTLTDQVDLLLYGAPADKCLVLVFDQFEEVFSQRSDLDERHAFMAALLDATADPHSRLVVCLTLRADFYGQAASNPAFAARLSAQNVLVPLMSEEELREAIVRPAHDEGVGFEPGAVESIIKDVRDRPGTLPLLQHALFETWNKSDGQTLSLVAYQATGGVDGALAQRAEKEYAELSEEEQQAADRLLLRLVQPGEGTEDTRRRATVAEVTSGADGEAVRRVIERFTAPHVRLLTVSEEIAGPGLAEPYLEVSHEALIRVWPHLQELLQSDREGLRIHRRLTEATAEWRHGGDLYRGRMLERVHEWAAMHADVLNTEERAFLDASIAAEARSREAEERRRRHERRLLRGLQVLAPILVTLTILAVGLAWWANDRSAEAHRQQLEAQSAQDEANAARSRAEAQALASQARLQVSHDPELGLLLAVEAAKRDTSPYIEDTVRLALDSTPITLRAHAYWVLDTEYSPDGTSYATAAFTGIRIWDTATGRLRVTVSSQQAFTTVAYSPDGRMLATGTLTGTGQLWNAQTGELRTTFTGHTNEVWAAVFSPTGDSLLLASVDGAARLWDLATEKERFTLRGHTAGIRGATFSPDGRLIATAGLDHVAKIWDAATGKELLSLHGHTDGVKSVNFSADSKRIVTGGLDGIARVWDAATGTEQLRLEGHTSRVTNAIFSADGRQILTASGDATARLWDSTTGSIMLTLNGHTDGVADATFSRDGERILTASRDGTVRLWDRQSGKEVFHMTAHPAQVSSAAFNSDGQRLLTSGFDGKARVWDVSTRTELMAVGDDYFPLLAAAYSKNARYIATADIGRSIKIWDVSSKKVTLTITNTNTVAVGLAFDPEGDDIAVPDGNVVKIWNIRTGEQRLQLKGHNDTVQRVAYSSFGSLIVSASVDNTAIIWDVDTGEIVHVLRGHTGWVNSANFSPDGAHIVTGSSDRTVRIWETSTGRGVMTLGDELGEDEETEITAAEYSPDGTMIMSAGYDRVARVWNAKTGALLRTLVGHTNTVIAAEFSPDSNTLVTASFDGTARIWSVEAIPQIANLVGHTQGLFTASYSRDGSAIVTSSDDSTVAVWDAQTGKQLDRFLQNAPLTCATFSPDGKYIAFATSYSVVHIVNAGTGRVEKRLYSKGGFIASVVYSPNGRYLLAAGFDDIAEVWDVKFGQLLHTLEGNSNMRGAVFSPDGTLIATAGADGKARIWDALTGKQKLVLNAHDDWVMRAVFSPDARYLATGGKDAVAKIWDVKTGELVSTLTGHENGVNGVAYSPDGTLLLTASWDGTARIWSVTTGRTLSILRGHRSIVITAEFSPDGRRVVTASFDNTARQYYVHLEDVLKLAQQRLTRQLTPEERERFLGDVQSSPLSTTATSN
jgi:WD40 repeat protein/serine/threonine protein kinase